MPESCEGEASFITLDESATALIQEGTPLSWNVSTIDTTDKEAARFPKDNPARAGLPYPIDSCSPVKRGIK
jgi:hypothetical protein